MVPASSDSSQLSAKREEGVYMRVVRKVLVLSYEGEDLLVEGGRESYFLFAKVLCKGGLLTGR